MNDKYLTNQKTKRAGKNKKKKLNTQLDKRIANKKKKLKKENTLANRHTSKQTERLEKWESLTGAT